MPDYILIQGSDGQWQRAAESDLPDEDTLQRLIRDHPEVLPFDDLGDTVPPLLVVGRETALATGYADVVAVDPDGLVTIIEAKLDRNPEVKRKVVAQVLGYAASLWGLDYERFDLDVARKYFAGPSCHRQDLRDAGLDDAMARFVDERTIGDGWDKLAFRENLADNLRVGRFRLVIVVDKVNDELRRIVEYLNACTGPTFQILCAELRHFATEQARLLVPALIGAPSAKPAPTAQRTGPRWDEPGFLAEIESRHGPALRGVVQRLLDWTHKTFDWVYWGEGQSGGFSARIRMRTQVGPAPFVVYTYGRVEIGFQYLKGYPPYDEEFRREALRQELVKIAGVELSPQAVSKRPSFPLEVLQDPASCSAFCRIMERVAQDLRSSRDRTNTQGN